MKRVRLRGKQSADGRWQKHGSKSCGSKCMTDLLGKMWLQPCMPEALALLDFHACCHLECASCFWQGVVKAMPPVWLEKMWRQGRCSLRPFLDGSDCCRLEGASKFWRENTLGEKGWHTRLHDRFGVGLGSRASDAAALAPEYSGRAFQKLEYFLFLSHLIVPGVRAGSVQIGQEKWQLRTKLGANVIVVNHRYHRLKLPLASAREWYDSYDMLGSFRIYLCTVFYVNLWAYTLCDQRKFRNLTSDYTEPQKICQPRDVIAQMWCSRDVRHEVLAGRNCAKCCVFPWFCGFAGSESQLLKTGVAEDQLPKTSPKSAPRLRARAIWKSKLLNWQPRSAFGSCSRQNLHHACARERFGSQHR